MNLLRRALVSLWVPVDRLIDWSGVRDTEAYWRASSFLRRWAARLGWRGRRPRPPFGTRRRVGRSLFDSEGEPSVRPRIKTDDAPPAPSSQPRLSRIPEPADGVDPRIKALRRAAAIDMFDQIGLEIVPGQLWQFIDGSLWIDRTVDHFLTLLGLDTDAIHRRDPAALATANDVLELLIDVESAFARLGPEAIAAIEDAVFSGEYERVREAARIVSIYETIWRLGARWPEEIRFAAFSAFLRDVGAELADPLSATIDDARAAEAVASRMTDLMQRLDHALRVQDLWLAAFRDRAGSWETWPEAGRINAGVDLFGRLVKQVCAEIFTVEEMSDFISRLEEINAELESIVSRHEPASAGGAGRGAGRDRGTPPPGSASVLTEVEMALVFFGFARDAEPPYSEIKSRWRKMVKEAHPDKGGDPALFLKIQDYHHVLQVRFER